MSSFAERWGQLTVAQALELNKSARLTCGFEMTASELWGNEVDS